MAISSFISGIKDAFLGNDASENQESRGFAYDNEKPSWRRQATPDSNAASIESLEESFSVQERQGNKPLSLVLEQNWNSLIEDEIESDVVFLVGEENDVQRITGHSWVLRENSPVFRAMFRSPLIGRPVEGRRNSFLKSPKMTVAVSDVDGRAFDILLRYLYNETVHLQSVMTALTTLYAAHKYMCPGLAEIVIQYLKDNLNEKNVLLVLQHICLYCNALGDTPPQQKPTISHPPNSASELQQKSPPSAPLDEDILIIEDEEPLQKADCCEELLKVCLALIDEEASSVLASEDIEDLDIQALKLILSRDSLSVRSELDTFGALNRWSKREVKRQKLELTPENKRSVADSAQYLVRWLTLSEEDFLGGPYHSGLLTGEERDAIAEHLRGSPPSEYPDHFNTLLSLSSPRVGKPWKKGSKRALRSRQRQILPLSYRREEKKALKKKSLTVVANKDSSISTQIKERTHRTREKFNIVEEFFICLACIFD